MSWAQKSSWEILYSSNKMKNKLVDGFRMHGPYVSCFTQENHFQDCKWHNKNSLSMHAGWPTKMEVLKYIHQSEEHPPRIWENKDT